MYICICNKVTDHDIQQEIENGACSLECLQTRLKLGTCCGRCKDCAKRLVNDACINLASIPPTQVNHSLKL